MLAGKLRLLAAEPGREDDVAPTAIPDERLELIFLCCHPALALEAQVALTLRAVAGLSTEEIARAFLVPADTMKRRLTRAKAKIKLAGIPFAVPAGPRLPDRLAAVLAVVYLVFNQGYGDGQDRSGLAAEAIRLGRVLAVLLPAEPEVLGLLALMLLHDARRDARFTGEDLVLLADQDRSRWDWRQIADGRALLDRALLDRAVAVAEAEGPAAALVIVDSLDLPDYQYWHSTRAELHRRLGRADEARSAYGEALARARTAPERRFLQRRIAES